jgi:hypothetical protein
VVTLRVVVVQVVALGGTDTPDNDLFAVPILTYWAKGTMARRTDGSMATELTSDTAAVRRAVIRGPCMDAVVSRTSAISSARASRMTSVVASTST